MFRLPLYPEAAIVLKRYERSASLLAKEAAECFCPGSAGLIGRLHLQIRNFLVGQRI